MNYLLQIVFIMLCLGCNKELPPPEPPKPLPSKELIWWQYLNSDSSTSFNGAIFNNNGEIYYINKYFKEYSLFQSRSVDNGNLKWTFEHPEMLDRNGLVDICILPSGNFVINADGYFFNIAAQEGNCYLLDFAHQAGGDDWPQEVGYFDKYIYASYNETNLDNRYAGFARRPAEGGVWENIYREEMDSTGFSLFLNVPTIYASPDDTLLVFQVGKWHFSKSTGRCDMAAYSLKEKRTVWRLNGVETGMQSGTRIPPVVSGNMAIFTGFNTYYGVNIGTGKLVWKHIMEPFYSNYKCHPIVYQDRLYLKSNGPVLYALDPMTGTVIWKNAATEYETSMLKAANGMIIFTSHQYLMVVNADTGKTIWKKKSPLENGKANFNGWCPLEVNERDSIIYACDQQHIMAIKMPKAE